MMLISFSSTVVSVVDEKSGEAISTQRIMHGAVRLENDVFGGSYPISFAAYSTKVVASSANERSHRRAPS